MTRWIATRILAITLVWCAAAAAQDRAPERRVEGNVILSERDPKIRIELPAGVAYAGADRWELYGVADCELHVFVEADPQKKIQRLYWVQFEGFLPSKPDSRYRYPFTATAEIAGLRFDVRARFGSTKDPNKPGSEMEHIQALMRKAGYQWPDEMMNVRLVYLPDEGKRKELMMIYAEDLAPTGFREADLLPGGKAADKWPGLASALTERAASKLRLRPETER